MRVLLLGSGGREHALAWKIAASPLFTALYIAPGNPGTALFGENVECDILDPAAVTELTRRLQIDLLVVGGEAPLAAGVADAVRYDYPACAVFGPGKVGAELEWSKAYAKDFMQKYGLPTAEYRCFATAAEARAYLITAPLPVVVKADGLAQGKGVVIAKTRAEALVAPDHMPVEGQVIVEEYLVGREASVFVLTDGQRCHVLPATEDHKQLYDGDTGPNTGGMGAYSPVAYWSTKLQAESETIALRTLAGLKAEGVDYRGVIFLGLMVTASGIKLLEFNARFGDPECQVLMVKLASDILPYLHGAARGELPPDPLEWSQAHVALVVACGGGYPEAPSRGLPITGIAEAEAAGSLVFHAGTAVSDGRLVTNGGRILNVVDSGETLALALDKAYNGLKFISFPGMHYRRDIGRRKDG
ncbi:MAG: Phosphoribosylamine--glycine ligase [Firmicutes bacterium]|nr:Phosphoribosylamine--glycine ligase [Bacillota bacterium]